MSINHSLLKEGGFIKQRQADFFAIRAKVLLGDLSADQLKKIAKISENYGQGWVHLTVRQGVEIPFIRIQDFEAVVNELEEAGLSTGACGPRVRVVVACPGSSICPYGLGDTKALAKAIDETLYGKERLHHKFKVGITGCPSSCAKAQENDLGFLGVAEPVFDDSEDECINCGLCVEVCPTGAISLNESKKPVIDYSLCSFDGRCVSVCPTSSLKKKREGWQVFVGGRFGRNPQLGLTLTEFVTDEQALTIAEQVLKAYQKLGQDKERLRDMIDRLGLDRLKEEVNQI